MRRFLADEDFDHRVVARLRAYGHDVVTVMDLDQRGRSDAEQLATATEAGRILVTFNRADFHALHRASVEHAGIVTCSRDPDAEALASRIHLAVEGSTTLAGELIRVVRGDPKPPIP